MTQKDIAIRAKVDQSTVSLALRNSPLIPQKTIERVQRIADQLGYQPDPVLSRLAAERFRKRPNTLRAGLVFLSEFRTKDLDHGSPDAPERRGAKRQAARLGFNMEFMFWQEIADSRRLQKILWTRNIVGIVHGRLVRRNDYDFDSLAPYPIVACALGHFRPPFNVVATNSGLAVEMALNTALERGYRRPGLLLFRHETIPADEPEKIGAFLHAQSRFPARRKRVPVLMAKPQETQKVRNWYQKHRPDVILGFNNLYLEVIRSAGIQVPEEVGFVSLISNHPQGEAALIFIDQEKIGEHAVNVLATAVRLRETGLPVHPTVTYLEPEFHDGSTLPVKNDISLFSSAREKS